jgi:hypothetical protein
LRNTIDEPVEISNKPKIVANDSEMVEAAAENKETTNQQVESEKNHR